MISMIKTILFDLDGTLLPIDMEMFLKPYLRSLGEKCAHLIEPKRLIDLILEATDAMINNLNPKRTNEEVFFEYFLSQVDTSRSIWEPLFSTFYEEDFPKLREYCGGSNLLARVILKEVRDRGMDAIIATNPVFPMVAILERMHWAGISDFQFKIITSYENMHFCKPNVEYYEEILDMIGADPEETLMVGNDMQEDMSASVIGIKTFLIEDWLIDRGAPQYEPDFRGSLEEFCVFLRKHELFNSKDEKLKRKSHF